MNTTTTEDDDLSRLEQDASALLHDLTACAGDLDATAATLLASRQHHGLDEHRRIAECALLRLFGTWAQPGPTDSSVRI